MNAMTDLTIEREIVIDAPADVVWRTITEPEQIAQHVWDEMFDPLSNLIDVYVKRLRDKLDSGAARRLIHTRRGEGYILTAEAAADD